MAPPRPVFSAHQPDRKLSGPFHELVGESTSESFDRSHREIRLATYEEVCGVLQALKQDNVAVQVVLSAGTLRFPVGSPEAGICLAALTDLIGERVSILRTPSQTDPIKIHISQPSD